MSNGQESEKERRWWQERQEGEEGRPQCPHCAYCHHKGHLKEKRENAVSGIRRRVYPYHAGGTYYGGMLERERERGFALWNHRKLISNLALSLPHTGRSHEGHHEGYK